MSGMGCPAGNIQRNIALDGNLMLKFAQFNLNKGQKRKACKMVLPLALKPDQQLSELKISIKGQAHALAGGKLLGHARLFLSRHNAPKLELPFSVPKEGLFMESSVTQGSQCGVTSDLRIEISLDAAGAKEAGAIEEVILAAKVGPCK